MKTLNMKYLASLVERAKQSDADAFAELYTQTYNKVYNYAYHYLRDEYLAQDALQEIYISAYRNLGKLNDSALFIAWLNRICFHVCFDISKHRFDLELASPDSLEIVIDDSPSRNPESTVASKDERQRLYEAVDALPFLEKQVITMRYINDMKIDEIASVCRLSRSTVKRYIASGKESLKDILGE